MCPGGRGVSKGVCPENVSRGDGHPPPPLQMWTELQTRHRNILNALLSKLRCIGMGLKKVSFLEKIQSGSLRSLSTNWLIHFTGTMLHLENESIMNSQVNPFQIMLPTSYLLFIVSHLANCENKK